MPELVVSDGRGLACALGGFHVDPWEPVATAVLTHAHADHARPGSGEYHCTESSLAIARRRLGDDARIVPHAYGEPFELGAVRVSLHPAGHVRGSAQVRIEADGETWVVSGDIKRDVDPTCEPFEVVPCDCFVTEATFALPIFRWPSAEEELARLVAAWDAAADAGRATLVFAYALGKSQRLLAMLRERVTRPIFAHGAVHAVTEIYRAAGVALPEVEHATTDAPKKRYAGALVVAPPSAARTPWTKRFGDATTAFASGWMRVRGPRRRRVVDHGLVISDHADFPALLATVRETGARRVRVTHGYSTAFARLLREEGLDAAALETAFEGEPVEE